jgi:hypothetical protein
LRIWGSVSGTIIEGCSFESTASSSSTYNQHQKAVAIFANGVTLRHNYVSGFAGEGLAAIGIGVGAAYYQNEVTNGAGDGINCNTNTGSSIVSDNYVHDIAYGIDCAGNNVWAVRNRALNITGPNGNGIVVGEEGAGEYSGANLNYVIAENDVDTTAGPGLYVRDGVRHFSVTGNKVKNAMQSAPSGSVAGDYGIYAGFSDYGVVSDNLVKNTGLSSTTCPTTCFDIGAVANYTLFSGNSLTAAATYKAAGFIGTAAISGTVVTGTIFTGGHTADYTNPSYYTIGNGVLDVAQGSAATGVYAMGQGWINIVGYGIGFNVSAPTTSFLSFKDFGNSIGTNTIICMASANGGATDCYGWDNLTSNYDYRVVVGGTVPSLYFTHTGNVEVVPAGGSLILKSANGTCYPVTVGNSGGSLTVGGSVTCPL